MRYWYCTCIKGKPRDYTLVSKGKSPMREVDIDQDETCKDCGYYAIASYKQISSMKEILGNVSEEKEFELSSIYGSGLNRKGKTSSDLHKLRTKLGKKNAKNRRQNNNNEEDIDSNLDV